MKGLLAEKLQRVNGLAGQRLDRLGGLLPAQERLNFADYMRQARAQAAADPEFRAQLERSLAQYKALGGSVPDGSGITG